MAAGTVVAVGAADAIIVVAVGVVVVVTGEVTVFVSVVFTDVDVTLVQADKIIVITIAMLNINPCFFILYAPKYLFLPTLANYLRTTLKPTSEF